MIQKICDFILDFIGVRIFGSNDDFRCFFTKLLENLINSLIKQIIGIRPFLGIYLTVLDDI